ncbi:MAG: hypothetical protein JNM76_00335 [Betaproteobacteria bacterium]|nr:hypothetical protein [Betaproteobacteria bacterium]
MKIPLLMLVAALSMPVLAGDSDKLEPVTARAVLEKVSRMYERECGRPTRCGLTVDARGACAYEVGVTSPVPIHEGSKPDQHGNHVFWLCLDKQGTVQHRLNGTSRNWPRA